MKFIFWALLLLPQLFTASDAHAQQHCDFIFASGFDSNSTQSCLAPQISPMGYHEIDHGDVFQFQPQISGEISICRKDLAPDDVKVDSETGLISWDTASLSFGRGFYIRIKCSNPHGHDYESMVVHVDKSGNSQIRIAGANGVSPYIRDAARDMQSGDTIVFPDGLYPVSVSSNESYENALKQTHNIPTAGTADQFSTLMAATPGGVVISGAPHGNIPKQKNAIQMESSQYVALLGFVIKDVRRESFTATNGDHLLVEFLGTQGAGTNLLACDSFANAASGWCSKAGMRANGMTPLFQYSYGWGHNRYGIMTRSTTASVTRRSVVRLDEHRGDQPYGGFSDYCDSAHASQDNLIFDSLAITAPHYKNFAGLTAFPATGCENDPSALSVNGFLAVNNQLSLSLLDSHAGVDHQWKNIVSYDSQATCTPQNQACALPLIQADKPLQLSDSFFGMARTHPNNPSPSDSFGNDVIIGQNVSLLDVYGRNNQGNPPEYLPKSQLYYQGKADHFHGQTGFDVATNVRRWPLPGEDIMAKNMRAYHNPEALIVGGGSISLSGNRGATAIHETISEYLWGYTNPLIPPLVVRVKNQGTHHRIAWEPLSSHRATLVTGWQVECRDTSPVTLAQLPVTQLVFQTTDNSCQIYAVRANYNGQLSGIAYLEQAQ